jgi:hypothetical protein
MLNDLVSSKSLTIVTGNQTTRQTVRFLFILLIFVKSMKQNYIKLDVLRIEWSVIY